MMTASSGIYGGRLFIEPLPVPVGAAPAPWYNGSLMFYQRLSANRLLQTLVQCLIRHCTGLKKILSYYQVNIRTNRKLVQGEAGLCGIMLLIESLLKIPAFVKDLSPRRSSFLLCWWCTGFISS